jgi:hypothetical protein
MTNCHFLILSIVFLICLRALQIAQTIRRQFKGRLEKVNWKGCGRKQSQFNLRYYPIVSMEPTSVRIADQFMASEFMQVFICIAPYSVPMTSANYVLIS